MVVRGGGPATASVKFPVGCRILTSCDSIEKDHEVSDQFAVNFSDTVFGFLEQDHGSLESGVSSSSSSSDEDFEDEDEDANGNSISTAEENKAFWDEQHHLLKGTLSKISSLEVKIRNVTKEAMKEAQSEGNYCVCRNPTTGICRNCLLPLITSRLRNAGYNCAVCKSKWRSSPDIPSGEHTFVDVIDDSKKKQVRVIIELNFRAEFEMARSSEEYNQLISRLPESFVGKAERVKTLIKILCKAAKKCMKDNNMHMGPWRKQTYMRAKWFSPNCQRLDSLSLQLTNTTSTTDNDKRREEVIRRKSSKASMLTVALLDMRPNLHCNKAVTVVCK